MLHNVSSGAAVPEPVGTAPAASDPSLFMQLGMGFMASKVFLTAVSLEIFTDLAKHGPSNLQELRKRHGIHERGARDFFDCLVSMRVLNRRDEGQNQEGDDSSVYLNTPAADALLDKNKPEQYMGGLLEMCNDRLYDVWGLFPRALKDGRPTSYGDQSAKDVFGALYADPQRLRGFLSAMTGVSRRSAAVIAQRFEWEKYGSFADVGCAQGCVNATVAAAHPHLRGIGYDLPPVRPVFEEYIGTVHLTDRVTFQEGDFFKDPLPSADVIVMGHILHDWGLEDKKMLLKKAHEALPAGGAVIVYDAMIDNERRVNTAGFVMSLNMLVETDAGYDYTIADCREWVREAGFASSRVETLPGGYAMVVGYK